jgi:DNA invertase Pin-like site-specific DNA recombinase
MTHWRKAGQKHDNKLPKVRAVAYYRHSSQDRQENSIPIQRDQVREWAKKNGVDIIHEFADACIGRPGEDDPLYPIYVQFKRLHDAAPCCGPGWRIRRGLAWAAEQGFWTGGSPPYGLRRLLLDEQGKPSHLLVPGQRKATRKQRVTLVLGDATEVATVRRIFREFVDLDCSPARIADGLNAERIASPRGDRWTARQVLACLHAKSYAAPIIYRRKKKSSRGKADQWVRTTKGGEGVVSVGQFQRAQEKLKRAK